MLQPRDSEGQPPHLARLLPCHPCSLDTIHSYSSSAPWCNFVLKEVQQPLKGCLAA